MPWHRKKLVRHEVEGAARFLTFSCYHRFALFDNPRIKDRFVECLTEITSAQNTRVLAYVIMPEHVHLVVFPAEAGDVTSMLMSLKRQFAAEVVGRWRELKAPILDRLIDQSGKTRFWQAGGGYDRCVVGEELLEKIRYCHANPVRRGLVPTSVEWKWSSARAYESRPDCFGPPIAFGLLPRTDQSLT